MTILDLILIGIALSMDAFAVTISDTFMYPDMKRGQRFLLPLSFGLFQGLMPLLGYFLGSLVASFIERYAGIVTFIILGFIGGQMIWDTLKEALKRRKGAKGEGIIEGVEGAVEGAGTSPDGDLTGRSAVRSAAGLTWGILLFQSVATSIDAFAVGVSFCAENVVIWLAVSLITLTTFLCCLVALAIGRRFGTALGDKAQAVGGIVLILIGIKALVF